MYIYIHIHICIYIYEFRYVHNIDICPKIRTIILGCEVLQKYPIQEMVALQPIMVFSKSWCPFCAKAKAGRLGRLGKSSEFGWVNLSSMKVVFPQHGCVLCRCVWRRQISNMYWYVLYNFLFLSSYVYCVEDGWDWNEANRGSVSWTSHHSYGQL